MKTVRIDSIFQRKRIVLTPKLLKSMKMRGMRIILYIQQIITSSKLLQLLSVKEINQEFYPQSLKNI